MRGLGVHLFWGSMQHVLHTDRETWGLSLDGGTGNVDGSTPIAGGPSPETEKHVIVEMTSVLEFRLSPIFLPKHLFVCSPSGRSGGLRPSPLMEVVILVYHYLQSGRPCSVLDLPLYIPLLSMVKINPITCSPYRT